MVNKTILYPLAALLITLALAWWLWPSDRQAIQKQLNLLTELSTKTSQEPGVEPLTKAARIADLFTEPCRVVSQEHGMDRSLDRKSLINQILYFRNRTQYLRISFHDTNIILDRDNTAEITTTIKADTKGDEELFRDIREIHLQMKKLEGNWRIALVTLVQVLEN